MNIRANVLLSIHVFFSFAMFGQSCSGALRRKRGWIPQMGGAWPKVDSEHYKGESGSGGGG